jgi:hypothetical protein
VEWLEGFGDEGSMQARAMTVVAQRI